MGFKSTPIKQIVGESLAEVLPDYGRPWYKVRHLLQLNLLIIIPLISSAVSGFDGSLMNGLQSMEEWRDTFGNPKGTLLGLVNSAMRFGAILGLPFAGWLPDYIGRKKTLYIGLAGIVVATIIQATSTTLAQLVVSRFIVGIAGQIAQSPAPMLVAEISYPAYRGKLTSIYNCMFYVGGILASWTCYGCTGRGDEWAWRIPVILQAGYPIIQLSLLFLVPESPRWLVSKGRVEEARAMLVKYHAGGDEDSALVAVELKEITAALEMEQRTKQTKWSDLVSTPGNRRRTYITVTLGLSAQWCGLSVISYYFTLVLDAIGITSSSMQTLINGLLQIFNFIMAVTAAMLVDKLGRRTLFLWSGMGMLISYIIWTACSATFNQTGSAAAGKAVLGFIFIFAFHYDIAYTPLIVAYPTEIFPFSLRAKGFSMMVLSAQSSLAISGFCNSIALDRIGWKYYIVFCVILVLINLNSYFFYPETKGHSLEKIAEIFDGKRITDIEAEFLEKDEEDDEKFKSKTEIQHISPVSSRGSDSKTK